MRSYREPQLLLNYLGRTEIGGSGAIGVDRALLRKVSTLPEPNVAVRHALTVTGAVVGEGDAPVLATQWRSLPEILSTEDIALLQSLWQNALQEVAP